VKLFLVGLACLFVGFIIWFFLSVVLGINAGVTGDKSGTGVLVAPFLLMIGGPLICWIILPIVKLARRRKKPG
jgi:hypothetical protein